MKRTDPLTPAEEQALAKCRAEWLAVGLCTQPADRPAAEAGVRELYRVMGWDEPAVVWMDSPLGGCFAAAALDQLRDQLGGQLWDQLRDQLWDQLRDQLWDQLGDQLWDQLGGQLWDQLRDQLRGQLRGQLWDQLWDQLGDQLWDQLGGQHDAYLMAWLRFARDLGVEYPPKLNAGLDAWSQITRSAGWWWPFEGVVVMTERHERVMRHPDGSGRLHCEDGPAVRYPDGWEVYAWRGVRVPKEAITDPAWLTVQRITDEDNAEVRRAYMEIYGQDRYLQQAGATLVDEVHEPPFPGLLDAKLWRMPNPDGGPDFACVGLTNSTPEPDGSAKRYALWVPPECKTAHEAVAWTFGLQADEYAPAVET